MNKTDLLEGEKTAKRSIIHLLIVGLVKLVLGLMTGLTVLLADALNTFSDILAIFAAYMGLKLSRKSSDSHFEFGYYKIETLAALLISLGILTLGVFTIKAGIDILVKPEIGNYQFYAILAVALGMIQSYRMGNGLINSGKKVNSLALIDSGREKKMDTAAGAAVLVSIVANYYQVPYVEGTVTLLIGLITLKVGLSSAKESLFFLLDYWDDAELSNKIKTILSADRSLIVGVKKIQLRRAGTFVFGQAMLEIAPFSDLQDLRSSLAVLQEKVKNTNPYIKDFIIYTCISRPKRIKVAIPIRQGTDLTADLADNLAETNGYLFAELTDTKVKKTYFLPIKEDDKNFVSLSNILLKEKVNILVDNDVSSLLYLNLRRAHHVMVYPNFSDVRKAGKLLELILIDT